ncbi:TetR/AcrR family transcriptional regulator [Nocardia sp. NPDC058379]|uniref:TetR/AcrR family transcriptional regulator n=1 Tax=unclassified Nocardia TaxID=2637762 RepID=UPI00365D652A
MTGKRRYSTALRTQQTALTRARVLESARALFLEHGYLGTTITGISQAAQVSVQTIYNTVGTKPAVFKAVYDTMLAGDDEPIPMIDRPQFQAMLAAQTATECLAHYTAIARTIAHRVLPLVSMALAQSATGDPDLRDFTDTTENERNFGATNLANHLHRRFGLRPGLSPADAADTLWALTAPELADRLVNRRGWSWDKYQSWLYTATTESLLASAPLRADSAEQV